MTVYFCLDDRGGLTFNGRRLSRDAAVLTDMAGEGMLTIDPFSEKLLAAGEIPYRLAEGEFGEEERFFLENRKPEEVLPAADKLVIYRWNRHYPSDMRWAEKPEDYGFVLRETSEFPGKSHEKITKEVYVK